MPVFYNNNSEELYLKQMDYLDGIMLTGGPINEMIVPSGKKSSENEYGEYMVKPYANYAVVMGKILEKAKKMNDSGRYFMIFAQCQSMMDIIDVESEYKSLIYDINNETKLLPVDFDFMGEYIKDSKMRNFFTQSERDEFRNGANAFFFHRFGYELDSFMSIPNLYQNYYPVLIFHKDPAKSPKNFLAGIESKKYPFFII